MGQLYQKREKDPLHHDWGYKEIISVANLAWKRTLCLESTPKKMALIGESASFRSTISQMKEKEHAQHQLQIRIKKGKRKQSKYSRQECHLSNPNS